MYIFFLKNLHDKKYPMKVRINSMCDYQIQCHFITGIVYKYKIKVNDNKYMKSGTGVEPAA